MKQKVTGHTEGIVWDSSKTDDTPRQLMAIGKIKDENWTASTSLEKGIKAT